MHDGIIIGATAWQTPVTAGFRRQTAGFRRQTVDCADTVPPGMAIHRPDEIERASMEKRKLGRTDIEVAPLALGGNVFGWTADEKTSLSLIDMFVERGFSLIDTADVYPTCVEGHHGGKSEAIIGTWLKRGGEREKLVIATKVGMDMGGFRRGLSKAHILRSVEESRQRLRVDQIDLYQVHIDDVSVPLEETLEALAFLVITGKVRAIGASNFTAPRLAEALATSTKRGFPRFEVLQPHYHLASRSYFEGPLRDLCLAEGLGVVSYYALAGGFLTGKYRREKDLEGNPRARTLSHYLDLRGVGILAELDKIATRLKTTPAQIAIAWVMAQQGVTAPIVGATTPAQLTEVLHSTEVTLDRDALDRLDRVTLDRDALDRLDRVTLDRDALDRLDRVTLGRDALDRLDRVSV
jgi:aryl-alcohol dehydrogenase-like predicted oxidoreductase